jgi:sugar phosphate isomerase/epimerase
MLKLGVTSPVYSRGKTYAEAAQLTRDGGFDGVQLSLMFEDAKFYPYRPDLDLDELTPEVRGDILRAHTDRDLEIFCLSAYTNLAQPYGDGRTAAIEYMKSLIRMAKDFGTNAVVTEAGTRGMAAYERCVAGFQEVMEVAEAEGVFICIEPSYRQAVPNSYTAAGLIQDVGSDNLKVLLDPANILCYDAVDRMFDVLGDHIIYGHAKDCIVDEKGDPTFPSAGQGMVPYHRFIELLLEYEVPVLIIEYANPENIDEVHEFLSGVIADVTGA